MAREFTLSTKTTLCSVTNTQLSFLRRVNAPWRNTVHWRHLTAGATLCILFAPEDRERAGFHSKHTELQVSLGEVEH